MDAMDNNGKKDTYYSPNFKVPLCRCQWVKLSGGGVTKDEYGMTIVDLNNLGYRDEPFVLDQDFVGAYQRHLAMSPTDANCGVAVFHEPRINPQAHGIPL